MRRCAVLVALLIISACATRAEVFASNLSTHEVFGYDELTGSRTRTFVAAANGGLNQPHGIMPRGTDVLVASFGNATIKRYDRVNGLPLGDFVTAAQGLSQPVALKPGRDGHLYVSSQGNSRILRFNLQSGAAIDGSPFISGGLLNGPSGFNWSPDGTVLYVAGRYSANVLAYDAATGAPLTTGHVFASGLGAGNTYGLAVAPNGDVFVATSNAVGRYSPAGALLATISVASIGLELAPDGAGILTASGGTIRRINLSNNSVVAAPQIAQPVGGVLNFFWWPPPIVPPQPLTVEFGGQRYAAMRFMVMKSAAGLTRVQFSNDLFSWQDAVTYTPIGTGFTRTGPGLTVQHEFTDYGDSIIVIERDAEPIGSQRRRFYRIPFG